MKEFVLFILLCPLLSAAQNKTHRFENDTLYTSCGYKIYEGQTLNFGTHLSGMTGEFRYIGIITNGISSASLENNSVLVKHVWKYGYALFALKTKLATINVEAAVNFRDGSKGIVELLLAFDEAIGSRLPGTSNELLVPEEFRITKEQAIAMNRPAFAEDTLFASCGFKFYKGQLLQFGKTTGKLGRFRYLNIRTNITHDSVENQQLRVKELKEFGISVLDNAYITIIGTLVYKNTDQRELEIHMSIDHAIENIPGLPSELVVPEEFRNRVKTDPKEELKRVLALYQSNIIKKEEYEAAKKYLPAQ